MELKANLILSLELKALTCIELKGTQGLTTLLTF